LPMRLVIVLPSFVVKIYMALARFMHGIQPF